MSWSYSGNPSLSVLDKTRFLIGDTNSADQQMSDEEINTILADNGNEPYTAAISLAYRLAALYSRRADKTVGDLSIKWSQVADAFRKLATQLKNEATLQGDFPPYAGGISISDKQAQEDDPDRVRPSFAIGMHDATPQPAGSDETQQ